MPHVIMLNVVMKSVNKKSQEDKGTSNFFGLSLIVEGAQWNSALQKV
jgi:hypothetical protein